MVILGVLKGRRLGDRELKVHKREQFYCIPQGIGCFGCAKTHAQVVTGGQSYRTTPC